MIDITVVIFDIWSLSDSPIVHSDRKEILPNEKLQNWTHKKPYYVKTSVFILLSFQKSNLQKSIKNIFW